MFSKEEQLLALTNQLCVSYRGTKGKWTYYQPAIYIKYKTKKGKLVWKLYRESTFKTRSAGLADDESREMAERYRIPYRPEVRQWTEVR